MKRRFWSTGLLSELLIYLLLLLLCFSILYPLYYMFIVSISSGGAVTRGDVTWLPVGANLKAYKAVMDNPGVLQAYSNTFLYTTVGTAINVCMSALCAYPLARKKFFARTFFSAIIVFTMFFEGGIIPSYLVVYQLGLLDSIWAIVLPPAIIVWYMIIMRTFFQQIPEELHESAHMDGASELTVFIRMIVPLSVPVLATMILFYSVWHWNSFFPSLIYLNEQSLYPMQLLMRNIVIQGTMASAAEATTIDNGELSVMVTNIKYAVIFVTILPILLVYPFIQKYFIRGMMVGSLKG
jgi:putative aldouronate transport system permease protein